MLSISDGLLPLVLVFNTEEWTTVTDFYLCDYHNHLKNLAVPPYVVAVHVLEYPPCLEVSVDGLVAISCAGLHFLVFYWIARVIRALYLVGGVNSISVISLDSLTRLKEVTEDLVKNNNVSEASSWVGTLDPY